MDKDWIKRLETENIVLTTEKDWVKVTISQQEIQEATALGTKQENDSKARGLNDNSFDGGNGKSLLRTIVSKQAEFAVRRFGGGTARVTQPNEFHDYPDVGQVNVRYIFDKEDGLMIMKKDQNDVPIVLVSGQSPDFYLMGWIRPAHAKYIIFKINLGRPEPVAGFLNNMQPHEACTFSSKWLNPMCDLSKDLIK